MGVRQDYGDGSSRVPLLYEQCFQRCLPSRQALLIEQWHTENPASAINLSHTRTDGVRRVARETAGRPAYKSICRAVRPLVTSSQKSKILSRPVTRKTPQTWVESPQIFNFR